MDRNQEEVGIHILENVRNELYYYFPYLDGAFACISGKGSEETRTKKEKEQRKNGTSFFPILPQTVRITGNGGEVRKGTRRKRQER